MVPPFTTNTDELAPPVPKVKSRNTRILRQIDQPKIKKATLTTKVRGPNCQQRWTRLKLLRKTQKWKLLSEKLVEANTHDLLDGKYKLEMTASGRENGILVYWTSKTIFFQGWRFVDQTMQGEHKLIKEYLPTSTAFALGNHWQLLWPLGPWKRTFDVLKTTRGGITKRAWKTKDVAIDDDAFKGLR